MGLTEYFLVVYEVLYYLWFLKWVKCLLQFSCIYSKVITFGIYEHFSTATVFYYVQSVVLHFYHVADN